VGVVAVPSRSGRDPLCSKFVREGIRSPSPQGRVKLSCGLSVESCAFKTAFNLPSTHNPQPATLNLPFIVPSRSGRDLQSNQCGMPSLRVSVPSRSGRDLVYGRPMGCGFAVAVPSRSGRDFQIGRRLRGGRANRRPLKVGSGHPAAPTRAWLPRKSPSPQGRVGTATGDNDIPLAIASPSPQGRVGTRQFGYN